MIHKKYQREYDACKNRHDRAKKADEWGEVYQATNDCEKVIEKEKEELKNLDPNSKEYKELETQIEDHERDAWSTRVDDRGEQNTYKAKSDCEKYRQQNDELMKKMSNDVARGDYKSYDEHRAQYEKKLEAQESMEKHMKMNGQDPGKSTTVDQRRDLLNSDIDMRNKMNEKIAKDQEKGKAPKKEELAAQQRYAQNVKKGEIDVVKKQGEQKIESMEKNGASKERIEMEKEQNARDQKWVEGINR